MGLLENAKAKIEELRTLNDFLNTFLFSVSRSEWIQIDPDFVKAIDIYQDIRQKIIDKANELPIV